MLAGACAPNVVARTAVGESSGTLGVAGCDAEVLQKGCEARVVKEEMDVSLSIELGGGL